MTNESMGPDSLRDKAAVALFTIGLAGSALFVPLYAATGVLEALSVELSTSGPLEAALLVVFACLVLPILIVDRSDENYHWRAVNKEEDLE